MVLEGGVAISLGARDPKIEGVVPKPGARSYCSWDLDAGSLGPHLVEVIRFKPPCLNRAP